MQKILSALLACALALGLLGTVPVGKAAEPKLTLEKEHLLAFSKAPLRIEKVEALPNGNLAVLYFSKGEGPEEESYWLDVFSSAGEHLLSKKLASFIPGGPNYPRAQLLIKDNKFVCETYPDVTSMEVCYRSVYTFEGKLLQSDQKSTLKFGEAAYANNLGPFILGIQAHAEDVAPPNPYRRLHIEHVPTGQTLTTSTYDFKPAFCVDEKGRLWVLQKNEEEHLELRCYTAGDSLREQIAEIAEPSLLAHEFTSLQSAIGFEDKIRLLIYLTNTEYVDLTYDPGSQKITDRRGLTALPGASYVSGYLVLGSQILAVNQVWDEGSQTFSKILGLVDAEGVPLPLPFSGEAFGLYTLGEDRLCALERDADDQALQLRTYLLHSGSRQ